MGVSIEQDLIDFIVCILQQGFDFRNGIILRHLLEQLYSNKSTDIPILIIQNICSINCHHLRFAHQLQHNSNMKQKSNVQLNQYSVRGEEIERMVDGRYTNSQQQAQWMYQNQVREVSTKNRYKYQDVVLSHKIAFLDDMKQLIYDPKLSPDDRSLFTAESSWKLIGFEQQDFSIPEDMPSLACMKRNGMEGRQFNEVWGSVQLQGRLNVKINDTAYNPYFFNLRKRILLFYSMGEPETQGRQDLAIPFTQTSFTFQSQNDQYFSLKFGERVLKIKKENDSRQAIKQIQRCLFLCSFRGTFVLRNEVPSYSVQDYVQKEIQTIKGIDFVHEKKLNSAIVDSRYYRQAIGGFFYLLNKETFKRKTMSMEITFPKWLKPKYNIIPHCQLNVMTNVVPNKVPLLNLKIKLSDNEIALLNENLKYIFPFKKEFLKRTLVVYESNLQDDQVGYMMRQISYPMHTIGLPKNQLSLIGLEHVINAAGTLYHQVIDFSFNAKLISISGPKIFSLANANPSIKKITIRGCYILLGEEDQFFQGLSNNMCLQEFQIDYMDSYNQSMIKHLSNYDAEMY